LEWLNGELKMCGWAGVAASVPNNVINMKEFNFFIPEEADIFINIVSVISNLYNNVSTFSKK
jgi:hypothetical protein